MLALGSSIATLIYAQLLPMIEMSASLQQTSSSYYAAQAAKENAALILRQQQAWFSGSGGWDGNTQRGPLSDAPMARDDNRALFGIQNSSQHRRIDAKTQRIPAIWEGQLPIYVDQDQTSYNPLYPGEVVTIPIVNPTNIASTEYYDKQNTAMPAGHQEIRARFRINPLFYQNGYQDICACDLNQDGVLDDVLIAWAIQGEYKGEPFRIIPKQDVDRTSKPPRQGNADSYLRVSNFTGNPPQAQLVRGNNPHPRIISPQEDSTTAYYRLLTGNIALSGMDFQSLWSERQAYNMQLQLTLVQPLITQENKSYPFIERYVESESVPLSNTHYSIQGTARVQDKQTQLQGAIPVVPQKQTANDIFF